MADHPEPCRIRDPEAHHVLDAGHDVVEVTLGFVTIVAMNESRESTKPAPFADPHLDIPGIPPSPPATAPQA